MTDPIKCGPVTLAFCQDVQAEAFDYPEYFFTKKIWKQRRQRPDLAELKAAIDEIKAAKYPLIIAGGGVHYSAANKVAKTADLIIGVGTRFQDFTTGSWSLFANAKNASLH